MNSGQSPDLLGPKIPYEHVFGFKTYLRVTSSHGAKKTVDITGSSGSIYHQQNDEVCF
jgi:hypothetical protein